MKKRKANYSDEEILAMLASNFAVCDADKEMYASRYSHAFRYYSGAEPRDENNTGVDPVPVVRQVVDENFQILQGLFNGSNSSSVTVTSSNIKSTLAEAISRELNTVARNLNNISRKMESYIKETLLTGQSHMKIYLEEKLIDERNISFEDKTAIDLIAIEKALKERGFNDIEVKIKSERTKRTTQAEREEASALGLPVAKSIKLFTGSINAIAKVVFPAIDYIPFEEIYIHPYTQYSLDDAPYMCHRYMCSINDGLLNGWDEDAMLEGRDFNEDSDSSFSTTGLIVGQQYDPFTTSGSGALINENQNYFPVYEHYLKIAYKGKVPKLWKFVTTKLDFLQEPEEIEEMPFVSARVQEIPNSFYGMGVYDTSKYLQDNATRELRMLTYSATNNTLGRFAALRDAYDEDSLMTPRAGGVIEIDSPGAVTMLQYPDVSQSLKLLMDSTNSQMQSQIQSSAMSGENMAKLGETSGVSLSMMIDKLEQGPKSRANTFASTGLVPLYKKLYKLLQSINHPIGDLIGGYSMADFPKEIGLSFDVQTDADKQQSATNILNMINSAKELYGSLPNFITSDNVYSALAHYAQAGTGNIDVSQFITKPEDVKTPPIQKYMEGCELKAKAEMMKAEAEGARLANEKLLSEIRSNDAHASLYVAQMRQIKEEDAQNADIHELTKQKMMLDNESVAMDAVTKREQLDEMPARLALDAAEIESQLTAEQANIVNSDYAQGANVNV